jgi:hypothetical protein
MKSKLFVVLGTLAFVFIMVSCATQPTISKITINHSYPQSGNTNNSAPIPVKDYETVGIIIVKSSEVIDVTGNHTGSKITYEMLLLEAQKLDADDVINIRIDVNQVDEVVADSSSSTGASVTKTTYNYTATALAIKYTTVVPSGNTVNYPYTETTPLEAGPPALSPAPDTARGRAASTSDAAGGRAAATSDLDAWKKKWVYLGGVIGGGSSEYEHNDHSTDDYGLFSTGAVADIALLDFFSIGLTLGLGVSFGNGGLYPVLPVVAKLGYRFGQAEAFFDAGYVIGLGPTIGATLGLHAGPGVLFVQGMFVPFTAISNTNNIALGILGYKVGIGNKI